MPGFRGMRYSKFRHVYGNPYRREKCYNNIPITKNSHDAWFCAVNPKFVAIVLESQGGGSFLVIPIEKYGRQDALNGKLAGHKGPVLDIKWNPFNDNEIASCSEDGTVKVWEVPDTGFATESSSTLIADLVRHTRRVLQVEWHPTASGILLSASQDNRVIVWDVQKWEPFSIIECHPDRIYCVAWSWMGDLIATTCKDKKIRIIDARSGDVLKIGKGHVGTKSSKIVFAGNTDYLITTGTDRMSSREIAVWKQDDLSSSIQTLCVDSGTGIQLLFYDPDSRVAFIAGKGDGSIRYFEINPDEDPCIFHLNDYITSMPQCGLGIMPKRGLDLWQCELVRFYKLQVSKGVCEPVSMIVPRKSEAFQSDIYPPTVSNMPAVSASNWMAGQDSPPKMIQLGEHGTTSVQSTVPRPSLRESVVTPNKTTESKKTEEVETRFSSQSSSRREEVTESSYTPSWASQGSSKHIEFSSSPPPKSSTRRVEIEKENIIPTKFSPVHSSASPAVEEEASTLSEVSSVSSSQSEKSSKIEGSRSIASRMAMFEDGSKKNWRRTASLDSAIPFSSPTKITVKDTINEDEMSLVRDRGDKVHSPRASGRTYNTEGREVFRIEMTPERDRGSVALRESEIMVRSNGDGSEMTVTSKGNRSVSDVATRREFMTSKDLGMDQLRKAYLRQQEEIKQLKMQLMLKDQRIRQLEKEIEDLTLTSDA